MELLNVPNILTLLRILLIPPALYYLDQGLFKNSLILIIIIIISDFLDGIIARKFNLTTNFGSILDPIADKIVVLSFFSYLLLVNKVNILYYLIILIRDISQLLSVPILIIWKKINFKVKPKIIPKWGTAFNFLILLLICTTIFSKEIKMFTFYDYILNSLYVISGLIEIYILSTYIPRFVEIYLGRHDTFE
jgi:cardiolipin synthase (CMP-forming)